CGCGAGSAAGTARARRARPKRRRQCVRDGADGLDGRPAGELPRLGVGRLAHLVGPDRDLRWDPDGVRPDVPDALRIVDQYHPPGGRGMHTRYGFAMTAVLLTLSAGSPNVKTREIEYRQGDTVPQGFIACDDAAPGKLPGALATKTPAQPGKVKARILVLAGGADPFVPPEQIEAFKREMQAAGAHFEVIAYPGAKHGFTNPNAAQYGMEQLAYNAAADRGSWAAMLKLFKEVF